MVFQRRAHLNLSAIISICLVILFYSPESHGIQPDDCEERCGDLLIPYPFGTRDGCFLNTDFRLKCTTRNETDTHPRLIWGEIEVESISIDEAEMRVLTFIAAYCYLKNGSLAPSSFDSLFNTIPNFPFSYTKNRFVALGCDTSAMIQDDNQMTGCMSLCSTRDKLIDGDCSGAGCCQSSIPRGLISLNITIGTYYSHTRVWDFNRCSYAFLAARDSYTFSINDLGRNDLNVRGTRAVPSVIDWSIGTQTCEEAQTNLTSYVCGMNSNCTSSGNGPGYVCQCLPGYRGNPYLRNGCQDIDECQNFTHKCVNTSKCVNKAGDYQCECPSGYTGDGRDDGERCRDIDECLDTKLCKGQCSNTPGSYTCSPDNSFAINLSVGIGVSVIVVLVGSSFLYWIRRKRKHIKLKEKFFQQNGGFLLQQLVERKEFSSNVIKIFTAEELKTATKNYDSNLIAGRGGYGTVYKGSLTDGTFVAIKKPKQTDVNIDEEQIKQFISEIVILGQVNNKNIVHLRGCCLETASPILVYEFVTNGTLYEHLQKGGTISWRTRLKIAAQTAEVLSYLHSQAVTQVIHRDIKSTNILLDEDFNAKVSDFGASRLIASDDELQVCTMVQGTLGYLDPEYLQTSQLTDKSDVYSFGVVLVELLTGQKAVRLNKSEEERSLVKYFLSALQGNQLDQVLERRVIEEGNFRLLQEVAYVAMRCLRLKGEERPSMKQVAMELEGLANMGSQRHYSPWVGSEIHPQEESAYLLGEGMGEYSDTMTGTTNDSMRNQVAITILADGR